MPRTILTHARLLEVLDYNPETGELTWRTRLVRSHFDRIWNTQNAGNVAGCKAHHGYLKIAIDGYGHYAHRLAYFHVTGILPDNIDHKNGDTTNNRFVNLRPATQAQNRANTRASDSSVSRHKGVSFHKGTGKWQASLTVEGKRVWLGLHEREEDAAAAYNRGAIEHFGEFARLTLPPLPY